MAIEGLLRHAGVIKKGEHPLVTVNDVPLNAERWPRCENSACRHTVAQRAIYCCTECALAHEAAIERDHVTSQDSPIAHSVECHERAEFLKGHTS